MRIFKALVAFLLLPAVLGSAWAMQGSPVTVTVSYTTNLQGVPISAPAIGILALLLAVFAYARLRGTARLMVFGLMVLAGSLGALQFERTAHAVSALTVQLSSGNPATASGGQGIWVVTNNLTTAATITNISTTLNGASIAWQGWAAAYPACSIGLTLQPGTSCSILVGIT